MDYWKNLMVYDEDKQLVTVNTNDVNAIGSYEIEMSARFKANLDYPQEGFTLAVEIRPCSVHSMLPSNDTSQS